MSLDKSLKLKGMLKRHRNVLTRAERIERLKEQGRWSEDTSVYGLPKVRNIMTVAKKKKKDEEAEEEAATPAAPTS